MTRPVPPSSGDQLALGDRVPGDRRDPALHVDRQFGAARDTRLAEPARDERRVRGDAAVRGEDALRRDQAVDVVRARLPAHEDDVLALPAARLRGVRIEDGTAGRGTGRRGKALRHDIERRGPVDHRVQEVVDLRRVDPRDRVVAVQQPLLDHRDGGSDRGGGRALCGSGLEQVQTTLLDRELDVLHVAVVLLEPIDRLLELANAAGNERRASASSGTGQPDTRDDVLALRVR